MALKVWLPLNGNLENKGDSDVTVINNGATVDNNGKIGKTYLFNGNYIKTEYADYPIIFSNDFSICL
jgi:archaellum component FlaF (FlaF/FlaG flagellin family)